jgi:FdhE protein
MTSQTVQRRLDKLHAERPETAPLAALLGAVIREGTNPAWAESARGASFPAQRDPASPLLTGVTVPIPSGLADRWLRVLLELAAGAGPAAASLMTAARSVALDAPALLAAAIDGDEERLATLAEAVDADPELLAVVAAYAAWPLLRALRRQWGGMASPAWGEGFCPVCGDWPALAEHRGLERARRLRCARCGGDWAFPAFVCAFCGEKDHAKFVGLVPEGGGEASRADGCETCRGYLKALATLRAWEAEEVVLADAGSTELDWAATEAGFGRPTTPTAPLTLRLGPA